MAIQNNLEHLQKQEQSVNISMIQGLKMLSLSTYAMYNYLVELSVSNPLLEIPELPTEEVYENVLHGDIRELFYIETLKDPSYYGNASYISDLNEDSEDYNPYYSAGEIFHADSLNGSLELQLSMCNLSPIEKAIGRDIIGNLDESGYFIGDLNTICLLYHTKIDVGERVLHIIQNFIPKGIAARDVYEALCLQVEDSFPYAELVRSVIKNDLDAVSRDMYSSCAARYKVESECMQQVFEYIRSLEPRPGNCDEQRLNVGYTSPDILVKKNGEELAVYVLGDSVNPLRLNKEYLDIMKQSDLCADDKLYLRDCLNSAKALIHSVDVRRQTLHKAALCLVTLQGDFFRYGPECLRPLSMQKMAEAMGVNVSTISRVAQDKYISCQWGAFPMKYFFVRTISENCPMPANLVKQKIEQLILSEDPNKPITDEQISMCLKKAGYYLSRRTVSKYRQEAGIPSCMERKRR